MTKEREENEEAGIKNPENEGFPEAFRRANTQSRRKDRRLSERHIQAQGISAMSQMMSTHLSTPIRPLLRQRW